MLVQMLVCLEAAKKSKKMNKTFYGIVLSIFISSMITVRKHLALFYYKYLMP